MAFPVVESTATTGRPVAETTSPVTFPATISANALIVCIARCAVAGAIGWPAGWFELVENSSDASDDVSAIAYLTATGTEDGLTFDVTHGEGKSAYIVYSITGAANPASQAPQISVVAVGTSASPNPGALTPTGGAKDYLWLWLGCWEGEQTSPPASSPANYVTPLGASTGTGGAVATNVRAASAQRNLNAVSEDPPLWTISVSDDWSAWTMAVHPSAAQQFNQSVSGALTFASVFAKRDDKVIAGNQSFTSVFAKLGQKSLTGGLSFVSVFEKQTGKITTGTLTFIGSLTTSLLRFVTLTGTLNFTGNMTKEAVKVLVGSLSFTGVVFKSGLKALTGGLTFSSVFSKQCAKTIAGLLTFTGSVLASLLKLLALTATLTFSSTISKRSNKTITGILTFIGTLLRKRVVLAGRPFLFTSANWKPSTQFFLEVYMRATSGAAEAQLYDITTGTVVTNSEVSTTSTTLTRLRSSAITLVNGREYRLQLARADADGGALLGGQIIATSG